jgi:hypothetical protein
MSSATISQDDFGAASAALASLIETRQFRKEKLEEASTSAAIDIVATIASIPERGRDRLAAISLLSKAGEISKPIAAVVHPLIARSLQMELPTIGEWGNADDRYYLAKGVSLSNASWVAKYAAEELARAELAEKSSREIWATLAITRSRSLAEAIQAISDALSAQLNALADPTDTAYRKLIRIAQAVSYSFLAADVPAGSRLGRAFANLVVLAGGSKTADSPKLRIDAAKAVLDLMIQTLRFHFDALFDSDLYRAAGSVRRWWRPSKPPTQIEDLCDRLARLAFSGLHILARQGIADQELRQALADSFGRETVNQAGQEISASDPSLKQELSRWLATGEQPVESASNEGARELTDRTEDELLARLVLSVENQDAHSQALKQIAQTLEVFEPAQASTLSSLATRFELTAQWANALASKRRLVTFGRSDEVVPYDPLVHESGQPLQLSSAVRIVVPGIKRQTNEHSFTIVLKAIVQKQ